MMRSRVRAVRGFATCIDFPAPDWRPLEGVARIVRMSRDLPPFHEGEFMYMARVRSRRKRLAIHLYKHFDTRRYINLDDAGHAYAYTGSDPARNEDRSYGGHYRRHLSLHDAVEHLDLSAFDAVTPLFRSFST